MDLFYSYPIYTPNPYFIVQKPVFIIPVHSKTEVTNIKNESNMNQFRFSRVIQN